MKTTDSVPNMLDNMIRDHATTHGSFPEVLYLRQDEYDLFQDWAKSHNISRLHYYHYQLPHKIMIEWDGKVLN